MKNAYNIVFINVGSSNFLKEGETMKRTAVSLILGILIMLSALPLSTASDQKELVNMVSLIKQGVRPNAQAPGWVCVTPYGWCFLQYWQQPGMPCVCFFPSGPARGATR